MPRHHLIISGTGRAGTTFLVQLLTQLGLDTGFTDTTSAIFPNCQAGMEHDIRHENAPYIVKSPFLCDYLDEVIREENVVIDHAILPMRDLYSAAQSRRHITSTTDPALFAAGEIPGGLWHTENPAEQETVLARQLYKILDVIAQHDIPMTLLYFPRFVHEPDYLYRKIAFALGGVSYETFLEAFRVVSRPELVHDFNAASPESIPQDADDRAESEPTSDSLARGVVPSDLRPDPPEPIPAPFLMRLSKSLRRRHAVEGGVRRS
jgi:hypothetical protein